MNASKFPELKALRIKNGISQNKISNLIGISETSYNKRENGKIEFTLSEIIIISRIFNLCGEEIFDIFFDKRLHQKQHNDNEKKGA
jgi:putative transcriptional regulator